MYGKIKKRYGAPSIWKNKSQHRRTPASIKTNVGKTLGLSITSVEVKAFLVKEKIRGSTTIPPNASPVHQVSQIGSNISPGEAPDKISAKVPTIELIEAPIAEAVTIAIVRVCVSNWYFF